MFLKRLALHAAIGLEQWLGGPKTLPWRLLMPHGLLHFNVCTFLGVIFIRKMPEGRIYRLATTAVLLWTGFGAAGTLFFAVLFACLEAYAFAGYPSPVPSSVQQALAGWLAGCLVPVKLVAMRNLQKLDCYMREAHEGKPSA